MLNLEEELVINLCKLNTTDSDKVHIDGLLEGKKIDGSKFVNLLFEHKVVGSVCINMKKMGLYGRIHSKWRHILDFYLEGIKHRNRIQSDFTKVLFKALQEKNIEGVPIKGALLNYTVYKDFNLRFSNDVDILFKEKDLKQAVEILTALGYQQGILENSVFIPATKQQKIFHRLSTHELVPFFLETNNPFCNYIEVDVQFDIFNRAKNMRVNYVVSTLFEKLNLVKHDSMGSFYSLQPHHNLIQLCSHLYQDATRIQSIRARKDLELMKFVDVFEFVNAFKNQIEWDILSDEIIDNKVNHIIYYTLHFTQEIFGKFIPHDFYEKIRPNDLDYLNKYGVEEIEQFIWERDFFTRLFDRNRINELDKLKETKDLESDKYYSSMRQLFNGTKGEEVDASSIYKLPPNAR